MSRITRTSWVGLGLVALALGLRLYGIGWGLPQVYEEAYPFKKSWEMWGWGQDRFTLNPHFFNYPTFTFYVQFLGQGLLFLVLKLGGVVDSTLDFRVLYALDKTPFYVLGRSISALFGAGTVLATLALGRRLGGLAVGAPAALLVALNQMHIAKSQVIEVDVPLTLFATLCTLYAVRILEQPSRRHYLLAGLFAGLATSTKYSGALLPLGILAAHVLANRAAAIGATPPPVQTAGAGPARRRDRAGTTPQRTPRSPAVAPPWGLISRNLAALGLAALAFGLALFLTSPYILLDQQAFWQGFNYERLHMKLGHFGLDRTPAILYYLKVMTGGLLGWPLSILGAAGFVHALAVRRRPWAVVLGVFPVVYLLLISRFNMKADRYILPLLPLAALFATALLAELAPRLRRLRRGLPAAIPVVLVGAMAAPSVVAYVRNLDHLGPDTRTLSCQWIEANAPAGSFILAESYGPEPISALEFAALVAEVRERIRKQRPDLKVYPVLGLPMYQVMPEATSHFYDLQLYDDLADLVVTSSSVGSRYRKDPALFAAQVVFYDELDRRWTKVREFGPQDGTGPRIAIYRNPRLQVPFSKRGEVPPPPALPVVPDRLPGSFSGFFERLAYNYEAYGFDVSAAGVYRLALRYPDQPADVRRKLTMSAARCLLRAGQGAQAMALIEEAETAARSPGDAAFWRQLRAQLQAPAKPAPAAQTTP